MDKLTKEQILEKVRAAFKHAYTELADCLPDVDDCDEWEDDKVSNAIGSVLGEMNDQARHALGIDNLELDYERENYGPARDLEAKKE